MGFKFEIMSIIRLPKAGVVVLDGRLLEGSLTIGLSAELIHGGQRIVTRIKGVVLGSVRPGMDLLSLTVDLCDEAMALATVGDRVVSVSNE